jgi:TolB-like protein
MLAGVAVLVAAVVWWQRDGGPREPEARRIAVLPIAPPVLDPPMLWVARGIAIALAADLEGVPGVTVVDAGTLLAQPAGPNGGYTMESAASLARGFGATAMVHGTIARKGHLLQVDVGLYSTADHRTINRILITAPGDSLRAIADSAVHALLGGTAGPGLKAGTSRDPAALRAFLEGEQRLIAWDFESAAQAFRAATASDSTFSLAWSRLAWIARWTATGDSGAVATATRFQDRLSRRERAHLNAFTTPTNTAGLAQRSERLRTLTAAYPDDWMAWLDYAHAVLASGPTSGLPSTQAADAFGKAVSLNPGIKAAWPRLLALGQFHRDSAAFAAAIAQAPYR